MSQLSFNETPAEAAPEAAGRAAAETQAVAKNQAEEKVLSVSGVNRLAKALLEEKFPAVAVEGEISNFVAPSSGHWYFTLKDSQAQLRCAMFSGRNRLLRFRPENGMQTLVRGRLSIYEGRGDYQLSAETMEEAGDGALRRAFEQLKAKLQAEGLFEESRKREVDEVYRHIGIVTSPTGAAIRDLLSVFRRRFPATRLTLIPTAVQGREAPAEIVQAIETANRLRGKLGLEALIVGRGGGSLEDLQAFNEETVARAIAASELPVVSAVGHEIDFTIADFTADLRAPTPSAAAEMMSPDQEDYLAELEGCLHQFGQLMGRCLSEAAQSLKSLQRHLKRPDRRLQEQAQHLDNLDIRLRRGFSTRIQTQANTMQRLQAQLLARSPLRRIQQRGERLAAGGVRFRQAVKAALQRQRTRLEGFSRHLQAVSPLQTLARGYSISFDEARRPIRDAGQVQAGSRMVSFVAQGRITSTVEAVSTRDNEEALRDIADRSNE